MGDISQPKFVPLDNKYRDSEGDESQADQTKNQTEEKLQRVCVDVHLRGDYNPSDEPDDNTKDKWQKAIQTWKPVGEIIAVIIALWGGWQVYRQADASQKQLKEMQRESKLDERAWVSPFESHIIEVDSNHFMFVITVKNTGKTPALNFSSMMAVHDTTNHVADGGEGRPAYQSILGPGADFNILSWSTDKREVRLGSVWWIWGSYWYDDIFGKAHSNQFNYFMQKYALTNIFSPAGFHNASDDMKTNEPSR